MRQKETAYIELISLVVDAPVIRVINDDGTVIDAGLEYLDGDTLPTIKGGGPEDIDHGNPPLVYRNHRNNNVGGCDWRSGSICVIRY